MAIEFEISVATPADIPGIKKVRRETWISTYPNEQYGVTEEDVKKRFMVKQPRVEQVGLINSDVLKTWVAKVHGQAVGYCTAQKGALHRIHTLYVLPAFQNQRIGTKLIGTAMNWLGKRNDIYINVAVYNKKAISFYETLGFVLIDNGNVVEGFTLPSGAVIPEIEMVKRQ